MSTASSYNKLSTAYANYAGMRRDTGKALAVRIAEVKRKMKEDEERFEEIQLLTKAGIAIAPVAASRAVRNINYAKGANEIEPDTVNLSIFDRLGITSAVPKGGTVTYGLGMPTTNVMRNGQETIPEPTVMPQYKYNSSLVTRYGESLRSGSLLSPIIKDMLERYRTPVNNSW